MPVGQPLQTTQSYSCTIATSDPSTGTIEALLPGQLKSVMVLGTPVAFRWPIAGEVWYIINVNGTFYLDAPCPIQQDSPTDVMTAQSNEVTTINDVAPGDIVLNSPTGKIWVLGDNTGANDYYFNADTFAPVSSSSWIDAPLINSWVNYGSDWAGSSYLRDPLGFVHTQGAIQNGASGTIAFTFPVGYRPLASHTFLLGGGSATVVEATIDSTGDVNITQPGGGTIDFVDLSGIYFLAEQ